jgi:hypothetical protein
MAKRIKSIIQDFCKANDLDLESGGGFIPKSRTDDYEYGKGSEGLILHDGGDLARYINLDYMDYDAFDKFHKYLQSHGLYHEPCTCWYTSIYKIG